VTVKEKPNGLDSPVVAKLIKYGARLHVPVFRATNGRIGSRWRIGAGWRKPVPTLLLDHVGRKSGNRFTAPCSTLRMVRGWSSCTPTSRATRRGPSGRSPS
jgi:hypothetical protein